MRYLVVILVLALPRLAAAGDWCMSGEERHDMMKNLVKVANGSRDKATLDTIHIWCIVHGPGKHDQPATDIDRAKRTPLVLEACKKIITAHDKKPEPDEEIEKALVAVVNECTTRLVESGVSRVGDHDLFTDVVNAGGTYAWHQPAPYVLLAKSGDARARLYILEQFRAALGAFGTKKPKGWQVSVWQGHRLAALAAIGIVGTADDVAFIDEVIAATPATDKKVLAAAKAAREAAQSRPAGITTPPARSL